MFFLQIADGEKAAISVAYLKSKFEKLQSPNLKKHYCTGAEILVMIFIAFFALSVLTQ